MKIVRLITVITSFIVFGCKPNHEPQSLHSLIKQLPSYSGKDEYLNSPYVTAGDRLYSVGHQDGSFPDLGWHISGEMGGIWNHPIKLMDGFQLAVGTEELVCLTSANEFINYPVANQHLYNDLEDISVSRMQFVPDGEQGMIVEYSISNTSAQQLLLDLAFTGYFDLRPVWLAEKKSIVDGADSFAQEDEYIIARDNDNEWYSIISSSLPIKALNSYSPCGMERMGKGVTTVLHHELELAANESATIQYYISGSYTNQEEAMATNQLLRSDAQSLLQKKIERLNKLKNVNRLISSDESVNDMFEWIKYNNDWLMRDVPEVGRGISAGIPDYPWWFGTDAGYAIEGLLAQGQWDEALATIDIIIKLSEQANGDTGKIMHEASTNGVVFNPGNLNTTPRFIQTLWMAYSWTGKQDLLEEYYPLVKKGIDWIESQDKDGNGYADGPGMMEIHG